MKDYDVVVVGGGIAGLGTATLLQKEGLNVLVLEKENKVGGRARTFTKNGWKIDIGLHFISLGDGSTLHKLCNEVGYIIEWGKYNKDGYLYSGGKWNKSTEVLLSKEYKEIFQIAPRIASLKDEDIAKFDKISLQDWLDNNVKSEGFKQFILAAGMIITTIGDPKEMAAGEVLWIMRRTLKKKKLLLSAAYPKGGFQSISNGLKDKFEKAGGELRTDTYVDEIVIEDGKVTGVNITQDTFLPLKFEISNEEFISADKVVCAVPLWNLHDMINMKKMPNRWVNKINDLRYETTGYFGYILGLPEKIWKDLSFRTALKTNHTGLPFQAFAPSNFDSSVAPEGKMLLMCGAPIEYKDMTKFNMKRYYELLWLDIEELFPEIQTLEFKIKYRTAVGCDGLARKPFQVGEFKPDVVGPVKGLYFAGDCYRGRGLAINSSASSAMLCAEKILRDSK
ncbi:MAG: FAD-dependent oxidoreductase [Candidatus Helarchaeota archaeon]|nr:FAD-dependent oxidoreductase [Candidatus Helarchaeota archaeon]